MKIRIIPTGPIEANCVFVSDADGCTLVTDPGADAAELDDALKRDKLNVSAYLVTHGHADHVGALFPLWQKHPAPVLIHPRDAAWAFTPANALPPYYSAPTRPDGPFPEVKDGSCFQFGGLSFKVIATPGHSPGCVCFYFEADNLILTGDTLFQDSVGRTDLPGGSSRTLTESLLKLARLPGSVKVIAGHGDETTIGAEIRDNYFMQTAARTLARQK
jgi:hydroxyacylglutathione hydrolase